MSKYKLFTLVFVAAVGTILFTAHSAKAADYVPRKGDIIKTKTNATVFLIDDLFNRIPLSREGYIARYGNDWSLIKVVGDDQIGSFDSTSGINALSSHKTGTLIVYSLNNPEVFVLEKGFKKSLGHRTDLAGVQWIGTYEIYPSK